MSGGLYRCSFCSAFPFTWKSGQAFCYAHAVAAGLAVAEEARPELLPVLGAPLRRTKKLTLAELMEMKTAELEADGYGEVEAPGYQPDLFSESSVAARVIAPALQYKSLNGEPQPLPF